MAPHELAEDSDVSPMERFRRYRGAASWALVQSRYTSPRLSTLPPFLLCTEAEFLINRNSQMQCYILVSVCIRIMLKMGLHRDPSKLPNVTPFDGEMRRRMWNFAVQIDLIVSFHLGLPSMIPGIESDTALPRNLLDDDLTEDCTELPQARLDSFYTPLTYAIWKSTICRVFGLVARQAHSLSTPTYAEIMRLDKLLEEKWMMVPTFMKIKPLSESITDSPTLINQRFGLASLYQKSRCVLHRRYFTEAVPKKEHAYSRRTCLEAAGALLDYQETIYQATRPGGLLRKNGWFVTSLAVHDFLLAATIVFLALRSEAYSEVEGNYDWMEQGTPLPNKQALHELLRRSQRIWAEASGGYPAVQKACGAVDIMLKKLGDPSSQPPIPHAAQVDGLRNRPENEGWFGANPDFYKTNLEPVPISGLSLSGMSCMLGIDSGHFILTAGSGQRQDSDPNLRQFAPEPQAAFTRDGLMPNPGQVATPWLGLGTGQDLVDWVSCILLADISSLGLLIRHHCRTPSIRT